MAWDKRRTADGAVAAWCGFRTGLWQSRDQRPRFHPAELRAVPREWSLPRPRHHPHAGALGEADEALRGGARKGRARHLANPEFHHGARPGLHRSRQRDHRRAPDRGAAEARHHAERRLPDGGQRAEGLRLRAGSPRRRSVHEIPEDAQRRGVRCLHRRHPALPQLAHPDGPAGRVRPRPDHRRLPAGGAVRREAADRAEDSRRKRRSTT